VASALLGVRAAHGLSSRRWGSRPRWVGLSEVAFGVAFVILVALGYRTAGASLP
jgi:hypothetical protein